MNQAAGRVRRSGRLDTHLEVTAVRGEAVFAAAKRHSRLVRALRVLLPVAVVAGGTAFLATVYVLPKFNSLLNFAKVDIESNALVMDAPKVSGFSGTRRSYELSARRAMQSLENPKVVTLEAIAARLGLETDATANVGAGRGIYDSQNETLHLEEGISIETANGYQASLQDAHIDLKRGTFASDHPIELRSADSTIRGNKVEITDGGKRIMVTDGVTMRLGASVGGAAAARSAAPAVRP
ncbi:MAG: LPS export ABC transporter periplasmic protein LptC [Bauldia sp.]